MASATSPSLGRPGREGDPPAPSTVVAQAIEPVVRERAGRDPFGARDLAPDMWKRLSTSTPSRAAEPVLAGRQSRPRGFDVAAAASPPRPATPPPRASTDRDDDHDDGARCSRPRKLRSVRAAGSRGTSRPGPAASRPRRGAPWARATLSTIDRPRPVPGGAPGGRWVKKRRKILLWFSGEMPGPWSRTEVTSAPSSHARAEDDRRRRRAAPARCRSGCAASPASAAVDTGAAAAAVRRRPRRRTSSRRRADRAGTRRRAPRRNGPIAAGSRASAGDRLLQAQQRQQVVDRSAQALDRFADRARHQRDALGRQRRRRRPAARPRRRWSPAGS